MAISRRWTASPHGEGQTITTTEATNECLFWIKLMERKKSQENGTYAARRPLLRHTHTNTQSGKCMGRLRSMHCFFFFFFFFVGLGGLNWKRLQSVADSRICRNRDLLTYEHCNLCDWPNFPITKMRYIAQIARDGDDCRPTNYEEFIIHKIGK